MPLLVAGQTQGWKLYAKLTDTTNIQPASTDVIVFAGTLATDPLGGFQDSTHLFTAANAHRCSTVHLNNTKFTASTTASVNGSAVTLPIPTASCTFLFTHFSLDEIQITSAGFYAFTGTDVTPVANATFLAAEGAVSTSWKDVNGSNNSLSLTPHPTPATDHDYYVSVSMSSLTGGTKTGTFKIFAIYV